MARAAGRGGEDLTLAETLDVALNVNGRAHRLRVRTDERLLDVLRDDFRLTGAREGCGKGECGSCTVIMDGRIVDSCLVPAFQADGTTVETIEGDVAHISAGPATGTLVVTTGAAELYGAEIGVGGGH